jgi:hypothetical protein
MSGDPLNSGVKPEEQPPTQNDSWFSNAPLYPLAVAVFPVLSIASANLSIFPASDVLRPIAAAFSLSLAITLLLCLAWRSWQRGAASAAVICAWIWLFSAVEPRTSSFLAESYTLHVWGAVGLIMMAAAGAWGPKPKLLNLVSLCAVGVAAFSFLWEAANPLKASASSRAGSSRTSDLALPPGPRPDIFVLVLDGFGRPDALKRTMGLDLSWFTKELESRGFQVAKKARSNYIQTELSVGSMLNMEPIQSLLPGIKRNEEDRRILAELVASPKGVRALEANGYLPLAISTGFHPFSQMPGSIKKGREGLTLMEVTLLAKTPIQLAEAASGQFDLHRKRVLSAFEEVRKLAIPTSRPRLVLGHVLSPHPPFVFDAEGNGVRPKGPFAIVDGSDYMSYGGSEETYRKGYSSQVTFISHEVLRTVDALLAGRPSLPPIIILMGDHGSKMRLDQNDLSKTDIHESFSILYAGRFPKEAPVKLSERSTPINTFRLILSAMGAKGLNPYPSQSWHSPYTWPFRFVDVTKRLDEENPSAGSAAQGVQSQRPQPSNGAGIDRPLVED